MANCALRSKLLLIIIDVLFWLSGCGMLAVGVWLKADRSMINLSAALAKSSITNGEAVVEVVAWIFISTGVFIFVVGVCGLLAALRESRLMLMVYVVCLAVVLAGEITGAVYTVVKKDQVLSSWKVNGQEWIRTNYNFSDKASKGFNYVMLRFGCCGVNNYTDFSNSAYTNRTRYGVKYRASITTACCTINPADLYSAEVEGPTPINQTMCLEEAGKLALNSSVEHQHFNDQVMCSFLEIFHVTRAVATTGSTNYYRFIAFAALCSCNCSVSSIAEEHTHPVEKTIPSSGRATLSGYNPVGF